MDKVLTSVLAALWLLVVSAQADPVVKPEDQRELQAKFPYYFTGTNKFGQPVYLMENTKWDIQSALEEGTSVELLLDEYYTNYYNAVIQDGLSSGNGSILIVDQKGFDSAKLESLSPTAQRFIMKQYGKFDEMDIEESVKQIYVVNANEAFMDLFNALKPTLKNTIGRVNLYTENMSDWSPDLLSYLNLDVKTRTELSSLAPLQVLMEEEFPHDLRSKFPYHLSGYAADGSPIFIMPMGKYDYKSVIEKGPESTQQLSRLTSQMLLRLQTTSVKSPGGRGAILIIDAKGLSAEQIESPAVQNQMLSDLTVMNTINSEPGLHKIYVINVPATVLRYEKFHEDVMRLVNKSNKFQVFFSGEDFRSALREAVKTPIPEEYSKRSDYNPLTSY